MWSRQRPSSEPSLAKDQNLAHRGQDCAADGGAVGGSAEDDVSQSTPQERISERRQVVEVPKTSRQESVEVVVV